MKKNFFAKTAITLGLTSMLLLGSAAAMASETPEVARTKAWDSIRNTLGGKC